MISLSNIVNASGLTGSQKSELEALMHVWDTVQEKNRLKRMYYEGAVPVRDIGVHTVPDLVDASVSCDWPRKAVTALAERSRFDGFVFQGEQDPDLAKVVRDNGLVSAYARHINSELVHGCMGATVGRSGSRTIVRFHSAETSAMTWDEANDRIGSGLVVADMQRTSWSPLEPVPTLVNMHLPGEVVAIRQVGPATWSAETNPTPLDRPMMEGFVWNPDGDQPLGRSRITKSVRDIADEAQRVMQYMSVAMALYAMPQRYIMGLTQEQYDELAKKKLNLYLGSWLLGTTDEDGNSPTAGQFSPSSPQPYIEAMRFLATKFSGETGVPLNSLGVVQDNPSSAQAITASREDICVLADTLNASNGESLRRIALMAMAVEKNTVPEELDENQLSVTANFKPTMYRSLAETADAALKLAQSDKSFPKTDVFWEMQGFGESTIMRIQSDEERVDARSVLDALGGPMPSEDEL